jgi:Tfp pilus assembly protein PilN
MITIILGGILALTIIFLLVAHLHIHKLQHQVNLLDKEQHTQNKEIMELMKLHITHQEMLLQHIEILKYLVEQDPKLNSGKLYFTGPVGEA